VDDITVLVTGAGAPGINGTIYSLRKNFENRKIKIIGVDISSEVIGKFECNAFYQIPTPENDSFIGILLNICEKEKVDVILPQVTRELGILASKKKEFKNIGTNVAISDKEVIDLVNNKFELLKISRKIGLPTPKFEVVSKREELIETVKRFGYPESKIIVKPPISNGMRGLRVLDEFIDRKKLYYSEKPTTFFSTLNDLIDILGEEFPSLIVTEYLPGDEYTVDMLRTKNVCVVVPRLREKIRSGITFSGQVIENTRIIEFSRRLSEETDLMYAFGFQFKLNSEKIPMLLESNPRIQGTMLMATFANANIIYGAVKAALGEEIPEMRINWGTKMLRYWGAVSLMDEQIGERI
jgi:carbamoyl-phosphate synthase large subunit